MSYKELVEQVLKESKEKEDYKSEQIDLWNKIRKI